ncbi:heparan-alpha-glucosaminide N-acetyltransferase [Salaquimonas pukyongi]|uniref:heparan-alpha-glucosaminide N-acetyltransferase n=1 Tax=Salaquimonas pukyongi TaxID=2712698 RepID=UPI00096BB9E4|nr:heparan-alpha-glucosaminide N-acetyltransferase [Salaquimonas pukyongi]
MQSKAQTMADPIGQAEPEARSFRVDAVDLARGLALVAMTTFHFGWDLELFGFVERGFATQAWMIWYARLIASSFLVLVGVSFALAHHSGLKARPFLWRLGKIAGAAFLITLATRFATPDIFIFFGILHHIALATILCIFFVRLPVPVLLALAAGVLLAASYARSELFNAPWWWWSGLNAVMPRSSDYVPVFPFLAAELTGLALGKWLISSGMAAQLAGRRAKGGIAATLRFIGRNSLVYYLLHQPVMLAILYLVQLVMR